MTIRKHVGVLAVFGLVLPAMIPATADAGQRFFSRQQIVNQLHQVPQNRNLQLSNKPRVLRHRAPQAGNATLFRAPGPVDTQGPVVRRRAPQPQGPVVMRRAPQPQTEPEFADTQEFRAPPRRTRPSGERDRFASATQRGLDVRPAEPEEAFSAATNYPDNGRVDLEILFDYDSDRIRPESVKQLIELGEALNDPSLARSKIVIAGHTDAAGSRGYNHDLSVRRARAVTGFLVDYAGVDPARLDPEGFGEDLLKFPDAPESGQNRRVEIINLGDAG